MKQEPVAWSCWNEGMPCAVILVTEPDMYEWQSIKPLYTAPRELSIEEIEGVFYQKCWYYDEDEKFDYYGFARAILKKASQK